MKFGKHLLPVFLLIVTLVFVGCAPKIKVPVTRPAEINLSGMDNLAIGEIDGNAGQRMSDLLTTKLFNSDYYEVVDRDNVERIMSEHNFNLSGAVNESTATDLGKLIGASALIFGNSNYKYDIQRSKSKVYKDDDGNRYRYYNIEGKARTKTNLRIVSLETGKIVAAKTMTKVAQDRTSERNQRPAAPDRDALIASTLNATIDQFMKMIAPYTDYVMVQFKKSDAPEVEAGINYAKLGDWEEAAKQFEIAKEKHPTDPAVWYNLGLAYEYSYNFQKAIKAFKESAKIESDEDCYSQISNCKRLGEERKKLKAQGAIK